MKEPRALDQRVQPPDTIHMQAHSATIEALPFSGPRQAGTIQFSAAIEAMKLSGLRQAGTVQFSAARLLITGAPLCEVAVNKVLLLYRGAQAVEVAARAVQSSAAAVNKVLLLCREAPAAEAARAVQFSVVSPAKAGARSSAVAVRKALLPCKGAPAVEVAAEAVPFIAVSPVKARAQFSAVSPAKARAQFSAVSPAKAGVRFNAASQAKAGARPSAVALVVRRKKTAVAEVVHHAVDKLTTVNFG